MTDSDAAEQLRRQLTGLGLVNPLPALAVVGGSYVLALITSVLVVILPVIGFALQSDGASETQDLGGEILGTEEQISGIGALLRIPFQITALASFGSYGAEGIVPLAGQVEVGFRFIPFLVTLALFGGSYAGGRLVRSRQPGAGIVGIGASSFAGAVLGGLLVTLGARIAAQPLGGDEFGDSFSAHAAGFDAFFGGALLIGLGLFLGQVLSGRRPSWWGLVADVSSAFRLIIVHALILSLVVGSWIWLTYAIGRIADGEVGEAFVPLLYIPLLAGQLIAFLVGLTALGRGTAGIEGSVLELLGEGRMSESIGLFDLEWYQWSVALLLGLVVLLAVSVLWNHDRRVVPGSVIALVASWIALPVAYLVGALVLLVLAGASLTMTVANAGDGRAYLGLALWTPFLVVIAGLLVEALSRFVAPLIAPVVPAVALSWFRRGRSTASRDESASTGDGNGGGYGVVPAAAADDDAPAAQRPSSADPVPVTAARTSAPLSARTRKRLLLGGALAGTLLVLVIGGAITLSVIGSAFFGPEKQVEAHLEAMESGEFSAVLDSAPPNVSTAQRVLLTDEIGAATENRLTSHEIDDVQIDGDTATVTATLDQDGVRNETVFVLNRTGRQFVLFPEWEMGTEVYDSLYVYPPNAGATSIQVNGIDVPLDDVTTEQDEEGFEYVALPVLPGDYTVSYPNNSEFLDQVPLEFSAPAPATGAEPYYAFPNFEISDAGRAEVKEQINADIDACAESTVPSPEDCPFSTYVYSDSEGSWEVTEYPELTISSSGEGYYYVESEWGTGSATYTYSYESFGGEMTEDTSNASIDVYAEFVIDSEGKIEIIDG